MDEALARELQNFRKRAGGGGGVSGDNSSRSRKRKGGAGSGLGSNLDAGGNGSAVSGLLKRVDMSSKRSLPPQIIKNIKLGIVESEDALLVNNKSYRCNSDSKLQLLGCLVNFLRDTYFRENLLSHNSASSDNSTIKSKDEYIDSNNNDASHLQSKHAEFSLDELLDRTQNLDAPPAYKSWLAESALKNNPRVKYSKSKYSYRPPFELSDKKDVLKLLEFYFENGYGGIALDDLRESLLKADQSVKAIRSKFYHLTRSTDKKDILYLFDPQYILNIDNDFVNDWSANSLESMQEADIKDYLRNANIKYLDSLKEASTTDSQSDKDSRKNKRFQQKAHNTHLPTDMLQDYSYKSNR